MKNENLIHIKFDYEEAVQSKKDLLYVEKSLMTSTMIIKEYISLRLNESKTRLKLHRKTKELITCIRKIQKDIPDVEFLGITEEKENEEPKVKKKESDISIKSQLQELQNKLDALQK